MDAVKARLNFFFFFLFNGLRNMRCLLNYEMVFFLYLEKLDFVVFLIGARVFYFSHHFLDLSAMSQEVSDLCLLFAVTKNNSGRRLLFLR